MKQSDYEFFEGYFKALRLEVDAISRAISMLVSRIDEMEKK